MNDAHGSAAAAVWKPRSVTPVAGILNELARRNADVLRTPDTPARSRVRLTWRDSATLGRGARVS